MILPYLHVYQTATQLIPQETVIALAFNVKVIDTLNVFDPTVNNNKRYYPTVPGWYDCFAQLAMFDSQTPFNHSVHFRASGAFLDSGPYGSARSMEGTIYLASTAQCKATIFCNGINDYIEAWVSHHSDTGSAINTYYSSGNTNTCMIIKWSGLN